MNEKYATDPMWAIKIARTMQSILNFSEYIAVEKELTKVLPMIQSICAPARG